MEGDLLSLKWNNHKTTFLHVIGKLRNKASYTDATLACNEQFFPVHRLVLSTCSDYFSAIFEQTNCKNPVIILKDVGSKNLKYLLDYMYIGEVNVKQNELASLVGAAECLRIKGLAVPDEDLNHLSSSTNKRESLDYNQSYNSPTKKKRTSRNISKLFNSNSDQANEEPSHSSKGFNFENSIAVDEENFSNPVKCEPLSDEEIIYDNLVTDNNLSNNSREENDILESKYIIELEGKKEIGEKVEPADQPPDDFDRPGPSSSYDNDMYLPDSDASSSVPQEEALFELMSSSKEALQKESSQHSTTNLKHLARKRNSDSADMSFESLIEKSEPKDHRFTSITGESGVSFYKCTVCQYISQQKGNARRHYMIHTGEKPYSCSFCPYKALTKDHLQRHIPVHTGEKPFGCQYCQYYCSNKQALRLHVLNKHKIDTRLKKYRKYHPVLR